MRISTGATAIVLGSMMIGGLAGCGTAEERARDRADEYAAQADHHLDPRSTQAVAAEVVARHAIEHGYQVLKVDGQHIKTPEGVTITILITSEASTSVFLQSGAEEFTFCYELWYGVARARAPKRVPCLDTAPVSFGPIPPQPRMPSPDELKALLDEAGADETAVRERLAGLDLDQSIRVEVRTGDGHTGAALRWNNPYTGGYSCVLGRTGPSGVETWVPARVYLQPGEMSCNGDEAARGLGQRPPH